MTSAVHSDWLMSLPELDISALKAARAPVWYAGDDFIYIIGPHPDQLLRVAEGQVRVHAATDELKPIRSLDCPH
jgi:hypothetical protein